jgi:endonuclease YncB( thermonuclease family)
VSFEYDAELVRVVDGDTAVFKLSKLYAHEFDFGFSIRDKFTFRKEAEITFRLLGITSSENRTAHGQAAKAELERLLDLGPLRLVSYKPDRYGCWRCRVQVMLADGTILVVNEEMARRGFAVPADVDAG